MQATHRKVGENTEKQTTHWTSMNNMVHWCHEILVTNKSANYMKSNLDGPQGCLREGI